MRRPASVNKDNIGQHFHENMEWSGVPYREEPIFKRASGACPGNGWGACDCVPTSGSFACNALPSDGTLVVPSCATAVPAGAFDKCAQITSFDLTQATNLQSAHTGFLQNTLNLAEVTGLANLPGGVVPNKAFMGSGITAVRAAAGSKRKHIGTGAVKRT